MRQPIDEGRPRPQRMIRRQNAVRLTGRVQLVPAYATASIRFLWYPEDVDGQAVDWEGDGYYIRREPGGTWQIIGVRYPAAETWVRDRRRDHRTLVRRWRRPDLEPDQVVDLVLKILAGGLAAGASGVNLAKAIRDAVSEGP